MAHLRGSECETEFLAGCDGARSVVREEIGIGFPGGTYEHLFYVADVEASGPLMDRELHISVDRSDFAAVFALKQQGRVRLIGTIRPEAEKENEKPRLGRREQRHPRTAAGRRPPRELVLDVSRAPSRRGTLPARDACSCSATPRTSTALSAGRG